MPARSVPLESYEQVQVANWLRARGIAFCHVPNGQLRNKRVAAQLKREGVRRGVPDLLIFDRPPNGDYRGVAIEMKRLKGSTTTPEQLEWLKRLDREGWHASIAKGHAEAIDTLISLGWE